MSDVYRGLFHVSVWKKDVYLEKWKSQKKKKEPLSCYSYELWHFCETTLAAATRCRSRMKKPTMSLDTHLPASILLRHPCRSCTSFFLQGLVQIDDWRAAKLWHFPVGCQTALHCMHAMSNKTLRVLSRLWCSERWTELSARDDESDGTQCPAMSTVHNISKVTGFSCCVFLFLTHNFKVQCVILG